MPVINLLPLCSKFTLFAFYVKMDPDPLLCSFPAGSEALSVEGHGETRPEEKRLISWIPCAHQVGTQAEIAPLARGSSRASASGSHQLSTADTADF